MSLSDVTNVKFRKPGNGERESRLNLLRDTGCREKNRRTPGTTLNWFIPMSMSSEHRFLSTLNQIISNDKHVMKRKLKKSQHKEILKKPFLRPNGSNRPKHGRHNNNLLQQSTVACVDPVLDLKLLRLHLKSSADVLGTTGTLLRSLLLTWAGF